MEIFGPEKIPTKRGKKKRGGRGEQMSSIITPALSFLAAAPRGRKGFFERVPFIGERKGRGKGKGTPARAGLGKRNQRKKRYTRALRAVDEKEGKKGGKPTCGRDSSGIHPRAKVRSGEREGGGGQLHLFRPSVRGKTTVERRGRGGEGRYSLYLGGKKGTQTCNDGRLRKRSRNAAFRLGGGSTSRLCGMKKRGGEKSLI